MNWNAYFCGGVGDLSKRFLPKQLPPYFEIAILEPLTVAEAFGPVEVSTVRSSRDLYVLKYVDERTRTAIYLYERTNR
jgi:hypothetical protein